MTQYFLLDSDVENRLIIDSIPHAGCRVVKTAHAGCWIAAKKAFGFPLTWLQETLLRARTPKP